MENVKMVLVLHYTHTLWNAVSAGYGWALYYFLELFPISVMYFLVVIFHIRATSSPLSTLVFMSQIVVYTIRLNVPLQMYIENEVPGLLYASLKVLLVLCGIWSLDFFRSVVPPFCVSSNIKTVHGLALEYLVAFYPICLILITYVCIKLHDNNFRLVVKLWKPFHRHFAHFRRRWDSKASIVNAFTTFLLLSFSKILFVSFTLLYIFDVEHNKGDTINCILYYDPTVECYALEYYIFAAIGGCVSVLFIIFPTILLILYPTRLFRKCASCCGFRRWHALHMFVESFQGRYKDGTNGTRDFRMASASFLILRIITLASIVNRTYSSSGFLVLQCVLFVGTSCFYAIMRPYKLNISSNVDFVVLVLLELLSLLLLAVAYHPAAKKFTHLILGPALLLGVPHMILIFYICYVVAKKTGITECLKRKQDSLTKCMKVTKHTNQTEADVASESGSLPDRLINPGAYGPVLPTTEEHTTAEHTVNQEPTNEDPRRLIPIYTYGSIN